MPHSFSIIIINFNYASYLDAAIQSALQQNLPALEVIVVDDCSTDRSLDVIARYSGRVISCLRQMNGGMSASANTGFQASRGDIVLFVDADDLLYPNALEKINSAWDKGVVQSQARLDLIDAEGHVHDVYPPLETQFDSGDVTAELARRGRYRTTVTTGLAFARTALEKVMPIPEAEFNRSADGYLATVVPLLGSVVSIEDRIGAYRRHTSNHSGFSADIAQRARWRIDHDEKRYEALRRCGLQHSIEIAADVGLNDPLHLEERLASLSFASDEHPYAGDTRNGLGRRGARAALAAGKTKRNMAHALIFLTAAYTPLAVARRLMAWKMERASRPPWIDHFSGWLRKRLG